MTVAQVCSRTKQLDVKILASFTDMYQMLIQSIYCQATWVDQDNQVLTIEDRRRVIGDDRFSVYRGYYREWSLQIREVQREDSGRYYCRVNTDPPIEKTVMLYVTGTNTGAFNLHILYYKNELN